MGRPGRDRRPPPVVPRTAAPASAAPARGPRRPTGQSAADDVPALWTRAAPADGGCATAGEIVPGRLSRARAGPRAAGEDVAMGRRGRDGRPPPVVPRPRRRGAAGEDVAMGRRDRDRRPPPTPLRLVPSRIAVPPPPAPRLIPPSSPPLAPSTRHAITATHLPCLSRALLRTPPPLRAPVTVGSLWSEKWVGAANGKK